MEGAGHTLVNSGPRAVQPNGYCKNWDLEANCLGWKAFTIDLGSEDPCILWSPNCESQGAKGPSRRVAVALTS